jgi:hypothetical protein
VRHAIVDLIVRPRPQRCRATERPIGENQRREYKSAKVVLARPVPFGLTTTFF